MSGDLWAGAEMYLVTIAGYLIEQPAVRLQVVLFNEGRLARDLRQLGVPVTLLDEGRSSSLRLVRLLAQFFRDHRIEILHTHKYKDGVLGAIAARLARVPYVVRTVHGSAEPMVGWNRIKERVYHRLDAMIVRRVVDLVIAVSSRMAETLRESGCRPTMVTYIHNGVDPERVQATRTREDVRRELGIDQRALFIGTAGRLDPVKGHIGLLRAAKTILQADPHARFAVIGDGPLGKQLMTQATELHVDQAFHFIGPRADVFDLMAAMDIFVLPSLNEGIPMALLEAMTLARPAVAAAVGGIPEVIQDRCNGLLVPAGDDVALAEACIELSRDAQLAQALGREARRTVLERFTHERSGAALLMNYRGLALVSEAHMGVAR
jgi:glycosyltransferase involved in cell wall biosynthesis